MLDKLYTGGYAAHEHLVNKLAFRPQFALIPPLPPRALNFHETSFRFDPSLFFYPTRLFIFLCIEIETSVKIRSFG